MASGGWKQLVAGVPWFQGEGSYPIPAYSEYMPAPRLGWKPYWQAHDSVLFADNDPWGWHVTEYEESFELCPGLEHLAHILLGALVHLGRGEPAHGIAQTALDDNPYWPMELSKRAGSLHHERFVALLPLALSRTQDDKGRVRWTLFGGSEQGPARAFWQGFYTAPGREVPADQALAFIRGLLGDVYGEHAEDAARLRRAGFRILPDESAPLVPFWEEGPLPAWTEPYLWKPGQALKSVKYLLTFQAFDRLPVEVRQAYAAGELHLIPFPGSLVFWGPERYHELQRELPLAVQVPLLHSVPRHEGPSCLRVPQSGVLHEQRPGGPAPSPRHGPTRNTYKRTHRWAKVHRDEDELAVEAREERLVHVLFSTDPDDMGLYGKPMARNVQIWSHDYRLLLDGPAAEPPAIKQAEHAVCQGGTFGYRFQFPAMRVGLHEVYWHRPLAAYLSPKTGQPALLHQAPLGYLTAYQAEHPDPARPIVLWPRLLARDDHVAAVRIFQHVHDPRPHMTARNVRKLLDASQLLERPLPLSFARQLVNLPRHQTLDEWLDALPERSSAPPRGRELADDLRRRIDPPGTSGRRASAAARSITYARTATRAFEIAYWKTMAHLAEGRYTNKDNADCIRDSVTQKLLTHQQRDLEALGDYLIGYYRKKVAAAGMSAKALVGDLPFHWSTDFDFGWSGGWLHNQEGQTHERDIMVVIPGRGRGRAIVMADHYDTAYMEDCYEPERGGKGARLAAAGADDNHSATAALMLGAPVFLALSRAGRLACDVWLVHLTGEEFPADCMGARYLCQQVVQKTLKMRLAAGGEADLSGTRVDGVYVLDMVAHNNDRARDIFQIAPGMGAQSMGLAYHAHLANEGWNAGALRWNRQPIRRRAGRSRRSPHGGFVPAVAQHPQLSGEVRVPYDPRSTLYNTDGQIFSDAGVPVVLFMENYDINRTGYHDTHDTMANIDLDYGAAVAAIAIESVARAASVKSEAKPRGKLRKRKTRT
jgi:hypothetical protein